MNKLKFHSDFKKTKYLKQFIEGTHLLQSTKSAHFLLRGKVGQLRKSKSELCWSTYTCY